LRDVELIAEQVMGIEPFVDAHGLAQQPRALGTPLKVADRFQRPQ